MRWYSDKYLNVGAAVGRAWESLRCMLDIWTLKTVLVRAQEEKRRAGEKASLFLENTETTMNRTVVEI